MPLRRAPTIAKPLAVQQPVDIKLPPFKENMPMVWFNNTEAYFDIKGVSDCHLWFYYTQWALSQQQEGLVMDITTHQPSPCRRIPTA